jgi:hypothetical protein
LATETGGLGLQVYAEPQFLYEAIWLEEEVAFVRFQNRGFYQGKL